MQIIKDLNRHLEELRCGEAEKEGVVLKATALTKEQDAIVSRLHEANENLQSALNSTVCFQK